MNYIEVDKALLKWYVSTFLEPNDYCLMKRLLSISNDDMGWGECFMRNNYEIIGTTKLSYKQMCNSRNKLSQLGLISFDQKNGNPNCKYEIHFKVLLSNSFAQPLRDLSKKVKATAKVKERFSKGSGIDNNKLNQTKGNETKISKSHSGTGVPVIEKIEELTSKKENLVEKEKTAYQKMVEVWFSFHQEKYNFKPTFKGLEGTKINSISSKLEKLAKERNFDFTPEIAEKSFLKFLILAYSDNWLKSNFQLQILDSKFDTIIQKQVNNDKGINNGKQANSAMATYRDELLRDLQGA